MTPTMKAWLKEADAFGMSANLQKGFLFCLGIELNMNPDDLNEEQLREIMLRMSSKIFDCEAGGYSDFNDNKIEPLLHEAGIKCFGQEFTPRELRPGIRFLGERPEENQLPNVEPDCLAVWRRFKSDLFEKVGENIEDGGEAAFLAGVVYSASHGEIDAKTTRMLGTIAQLAQPPDLEWFQAIIYVEERLHVLRDKGIPLHKTVCMLTKPGNPNSARFPVTARSTVELARTLFYTNDGAINEQINELNVFDFCAAMSCGQFKCDPADEDEKSALIEIGYSIPPECNSADDCVRHIASMVKSKFGYDVLSGDIGCAGEEYTMKACITFATIASHVLSPEWNKGLLSSVNQEYACD